MKGLKPFKHDGEEFVQICHWQSPYGPQFIDVNLVKFSPSQARKLARYLEAAANEVEVYNRKKGKKL